MFERYTEAARRALFFARYEASEAGSISIEPEHMLLGLLRDIPALSTLLPPSIGALRLEVEKGIVFKEKLSTSVEIPFSAPTRQVLQFAVEEADALTHRHIGTEHLLLGLLREEGSAAAVTLAAHAVRLNDVRERVAKLPVPLDPVERIKSLVADLARAPR